MAKLWIAAALLLGMSCAAGAQDFAVPPASDSRVSAGGASSSPGTNSLFSTNTYAEALMPADSGVFSSADDASSVPPPATKFLYGSRDDYRFQLGVGYEFVRFRSAAFDANLHGLHTSLTYYTNDWFGVEGSVVGAFGPTIFANDRTKYLLYAFGPKIVWRGHRWEPWSHALFGGLHMIPQVAGGFSKNAFAMQLGGGADYRYLPQLSFRFNADYVRSQLYSTSQNNFQFGAGVVFQF